MLMILTMKTTMLNRRFCRRLHSILFLFILLLLLLFFFVLPFLCWTAFSTVERESSAYRSVVRDQVRVLLFSYFRAGSSFSGSLFDSNPSAFYWFEPLGISTFKWGWLDKASPPRSLYHYDNGTERSISLDDLRETLLSPIRSILGCDLSSLPDIFFTSRLNAIAWRSKMSSMDKYRLCTMRFEKTHELDVRFRECIPTLRRQCQLSEIVAVKTIRLRMDLVEEAFSSDPLLRLVYVVRDPRGMLNSWWKNTRLSRRNYSDAEREADARVVCARMLSDWKAFARLRRKHPDNCVLLRYEDLAEAPDAVADRVYRSLGYPGAPRAVVGALRTITAARSPNGNYGIRRANSSRTASAWIDSMQPVLKTMVTGHCRQVLLEIGFSLDP